MPDFAAEFEVRLRAALSWAERRCTFRHRQQRAEEDEQFDCLVVMELATCLGQVNRRFPSFQIVVSSLDELGLDPRKIFFSGPNEIVA